MWIFLLRFNLPFHPSLLPLDPPLFYQCAPQCKLVIVTMSWSICPLNIVSVSQTCAWGFSFFFLQFQLDFCIYFSSSWENVRILLHIKAVNDWLLLCLVGCLFYFTYISPMTKIHSCCHPNMMQLFHQRKDLIWRLDTSLSCCSALGSVSVLAHLSADLCE